VKSTVQEARDALDGSIGAYARVSRSTSSGLLVLAKARAEVTKATDAIVAAVREEAVAPWREAAKVAQRQDTTDRAREERKDRLIEELRAENEQLKARGVR
jgi:hypothetical protein